MRRVLAAAVAITGILAITVIATNYTDRVNNGIYDAPSGRAVYIQGSACIINMEPENGIQDYERMHQDFEACLAAHDCHYGESPVEQEQGPACYEEALN